ncbi:two-component system sensor histidine kinase NtrB [Haliangium sp.]|uniref:two-component system sensor histidine kinase NtrB n=1 Tax=Haliangium sp. TaxID=2663208 RepID=UPI003D13CE87
MSTKSSSVPVAVSALPAPSSRAVLEGVLTLGRELHLEMSESALADLFLRTLAGLFPSRRFCIRALDPRSSAPSRCYAAGATLGEGIAEASITLKASSVEKTRLKVALVDSGRLRIGAGWDSPFAAPGTGFAVPLVASGECYGVLDVGYAPGSDAGADDEPLILPIANHLSVALRNERLHRETTRLRDYLVKLIEHANALIIGVDGDLRITIFNEAMVCLTGYGRDEMLGCDARILLGDAAQPSLAKTFREVLPGGSADSVEVTLTVRDGRRVRTVWNVAAVGGDAVVAVGQDQTKLGELQRQVVQAEKLATLGQLAAGVVHELNNPLTSITVYAEFLRAKLEAHARRGVAFHVEDGDVEKLRRIGVGAQRISGFARELVQYAKPADKAPESVSVPAAVAQALSFCEHMFETDGVALVRELAAGLPPVWAVPGQIEQVVINLVVNAAHAVDGAGKVTVRAYREADGCVALSVNDTGPGVPEEMRERIFEPFFSTKTDGRGTGLGLSIVRNIVEQHGGHIEVSRAKGGGASFTVHLPACRPANEPANNH